MDFLDKIYYSMFSFIYFVRAINIVKVN